MDTAQSLISGYAAYTTSHELSTVPSDQAPAATPGIWLSITVSIEASSYACGAGVGFSIGVTVGKGC